MLLLATYAIGRAARRAVGVLLFPGRFTALTSFFAGFGRLINVGL